MSPRLRSLVAVVGLGLVACGSPVQPAPVVTVTAPVQAPPPLATGGPSCPEMAETEAAPPPPASAPPGCAPLPGPIGSVLESQIGGVPWQERMTFAPNGSAVAIASRDGAIRLWDGRTAELRLTLRGPSGRLRPVGFHPSGATLASTCRRREVWLWDLESGRSREILDAGEPLSGVAFSPDGAHLVTSHEEGMRLWTAAGAKVAELPTRGEDHAWSPDGRLLATWVHDASTPQRLTLWEVPSRARRWSIQRSYVGQGAGHAAFRADGRALAWLSDDRTVEIVDVATGAVARRLRGERGLFRVGWSGPDAFASSDHGALLAWDAGGVRRSLEGDDCRGCRYLANPAGTLALGQLYRRGEPMELRLFDLSGQRPPHEVRLPFDTGHYAAWHPDGRHLAMLSRADLPAIVDPVSADAKVGSAGVRGAWTVAFSPSGDALASVHSNGSRGWEDLIRIWDAPSGTLRAAVAGRKRGKGDSYDAYTRLSWSPAGDVIAALSMRELDLYEPQGRFVRNVETRAKYAVPQAMAFSDDGRRLAVVSADLETVRIYDPRGGKIAEHKSQVGIAFAVAFSPDRKRVAVAGRTQIGVLDVDTGRPVALVESTTRAANAFAWLDRDTFFSAHDDGVVLRVAIGGARTATRLDGGGVSALALSADKKLLATGGTHGGLKIWRASDMQIVSSHEFDVRGVQSLAWHPRAPVVAVTSHGAIHLLRATDATWVDLYLLHVGPGETCAGLALGPSDLFSGDPAALSYVRWLASDRRMSAPLQKWDAFPAYRRETLGADLARGCPLRRPSP